MGRTLINCLLVLSLVLGVAPAGAVFPHELSERSTEPGTPLEREEAVARSAVSRAASNRSGKYSPADLPGRLIIITAAPQSISAQPLPLAPSVSSPPHLHQLYGVLRI